MSSIINEMSKADADVRRALRPKIKEIIRLAEKYRYLGGKFVFDVDLTFDANVNKVLVELSDKIEEIVEERVENAIMYSGSEKDRDAIMAYVNRQSGGLTPIERIDRQTSRLKYTIEGWLAIGFSEKITGSTLLDEIMLYLDAPENSKLWRKAFLSGKFSASILNEGDLNAGKGVQKSIANSVTLIEQTVINEAFQYGRILGIKKSGAIGYGVKRNSTFNCPLCDDVCSVVHPFTEIVVPVHPRCVCTVFPVFEND